MKIACICEDDRSVGTILSGLDSDFEIPLVIRPDFSVTARRSKPITVSRIVGVVLQRFVRAPFFKIWAMKPSHAEIDKYLPANPVLPPIGETVSISVKEINSEQTAELIAGHQPDLLFVCGAPILKARIFEIAKYGAVNFHFGYAPKYRGIHTLVWPYLCRDFTNIGGTFHMIDRGVDTGEALAYVFPEIKSNESIDMISANLALLAKQEIGGILKSIVADTNSDPLKISNNTGGATIRFADYGIVTQLRYQMQWLKNKRSKITSLQAQRVVKS